MSVKHGWRNAVAFGNPRCRCIYFYRRLLKMSWSNHMDPEAVAAVAPDKTRVLPPEAIAFNNSLKSTRQWLTGEKEVNFNFILPCANWAVEEKQCKKQP
jgi:hypothetical protein